MPIKLQSQIIHQKKSYSKSTNIGSCGKNFTPTIENLWKILKDAVQHGSICPKNTSDLKVVIAREWKIISGQKLLLLCHSMPTRLQAVIEASGGHKLVDCEFFCVSFWSLNFGTLVINM
jgi:hypothetical protein